MDYPKTDDDWVRLAECIVTKDPGISPETVGALSVDATTTIFSWYEGEERRKALVTRQYGRNRMIELGKQTGCLGELAPCEAPYEAPYSYKITDWSVGEVYEPTAGYPTPSDAMSAAKNFVEVELRVGHPAPEPRGYEVKVLSRESVVVPGYEKWYVPTWYAPSRPFPKTYGDWVDLSESIKEKYPDDPAMRAAASYQLGIIAREGEVEPVVEEKDVDEAKRWLTRKAGELGIK